MRGPGCRAAPLTPLTPLSGLILLLQTLAPMYRNYSTWSQTLPSLLSTDYGATVRVSCLARYSLVGDGAITCVEGKTFVVENEMPHCQLGLQQLSLLF